jgi:hypothetical protein
LSINFPMPGCLIQSRNNRILYSSTVSPPEVQSLTSRTFIILCKFSQGGTYCHMNDLCYYG